MYDETVVAAATCCLVTMHQDTDIQGKQQIKFHTFWTSALDQPLTEIAPTTHWMGEITNMVMKKKICLCQESKPSHPDHSLLPLT